MVKNDMTQKGKNTKDVSHSEETIQNENKTVPTITDKEREQKINTSLKSLLENGDNWQRKSTSVQGVSIIRLPESKTRKASLAVEVNPINEQGLPIKKRGIMIMSPNEREAFQNVFSDPRLDSLIGMMNDVSGIKKGSSQKNTDIIEI